MRMGLMRTDLSKHIILWEIWEEFMFAESRGVARQNIQLEEISGGFYLDAGNKHYDDTFVNDVSVSGAGIELSTPLEVGSDVDLTFTAGDWNISVQGKVIWCSMDTKLQETQGSDNYRVGVKFNPRNANNNVIFFMASRSMVRPEN